MFRRFFALTFLVVGSAQAAMVYENGSVSGIDPILGHDEFVSEFVALDFSLDSRSVLDQFTFSALAWNGAIAPSYAELKIYANNGDPILGDSVYGDLSEEIASFYTAAPSVNQTGSFDSGSPFGPFTYFDYGIGLGGLELEAGRYWVALRVDASSRDFFWRLGDANVGYGHYFRSATGAEGSYSEDWGNEYHFKLVGAAVPVPPALWLFASALFAVMLRPHRSRS